MAYVTKPNQATQAAFDRVRQKYGLTSSTTNNKQSEKEKQNNKVTQSNKGKQSNSASSTRTNQSSITKFQSASQTAFDSVREKHGLTKKEDKFTLSPKKTTPNKSVSGSTTTSSNTIKAYTDYSSAVKYLQDKGVQGASGIMTETEWRRRNRSGGTYQDYLDSQVNKYGRGNIDLTNRPIYKNPDGTISTVASYTMGIDGKHYVLPSIVRDANGNAKKLETEDDVFNHFKNTGEYLGVFDTQEEADEYAQNLHIEQEKYYPNSSLGGAAVNHQNDYTGMTVREAMKSSMEKDQQLADSVTDSVGYAVEKFGRGVIDGLEGITDFVWSVVGSLGWGVTSGLGFFENSWSDAIEKWYNGINEDDITDMFGVAEDRYDAAPDWVKDWGWLPETIGNLVPFMAETYFTAGSTLGDDLAVAGKSAWDAGKKLLTNPDVHYGMSAAGDATERAVEKGANPLASTTYGAAAGALEVATEKLFGTGYAGTSVGASKRVAKEAAEETTEKTLLKKIWDSPARKKVFDIGTEGIEEGIVTFADPALQKATGVDENAEWATWSEYVESGSHGIILAVVMNAAGIPIDKYNKSKVISSLNESSETLNGFIQDDASKLKPLPNNASEPEIIARQKEVMAVSLAFDNAVKKAVQNEQQTTSEQPAETPDTLEQAAMDVVANRNAAQTEKTQPISNATAASDSLPTQEENGLKTPVNAIGEVTEKTKSLLGDSNRTIGVVDGQAYVTNGSDILPSPTNRSVFLAVNDAEVAKTELGATESNKTGVNISKLLNPEQYTPISKEGYIDGNLKGVGEVRVFTDENGREIALEKNVAEYFEGYNLEATFRGGKPYAIKATDNDGKVAGVAMAIWNNTSGQSYNITESKTVEKPNTPYNVMSNDNPLMQERKAREAYIKKNTGYGDYGVRAFADIMETISEAEAPVVARAFQTAYEAGLTNLETSQANLPTEVQRIAFNAGKQDFIMENVGKVKNVKNVKSHGDTAGFDSTNVPSSVSKQAIDIVDRFSKELGVKAYMAGNSDTYNANITKNVGAVQIANNFSVLENLGEDAASLSFVTHALHEIADHRAEELAPVEYAEFKREMYAYKNSVGVSLADAKRQAYSNKGVDISLSEAMSEVTANSILELYDNDLDLLAEGLDRVLNGDNAKAKKGANVFKRALDYIVEKFNKFLEKLGVKERTRYDASLDEITRVRDLFEKTLSAAIAKNKEIAKTSNRVTMKNGTVVDAKGNVVAQINDDGTATFSLKTYDESGRAELKKWLDKNVKNKKITDADAKDISEQLEYYYDICKEHEDKYAPFSAWSKAEVVKGLDGKPLMSVVKANGDYKMNLDFSLVCKKRRPLDALYRAMIDDGFMDDIGQLSEVEVARINEIIRKNGFETACTLCFVDSKRYRQYAVADSFVSKYNELVKMLAPEGAKIDRFDFSGKREASADGLHTMSNADLKSGINKLNKVIKEQGESTVVGKIAKHLKAVPQDRKLVMVSDFMDSEGFVRVKKANPEVFKLYNSSKGSGGPKATLPDVQYLGEILKRANFTPKKAYAVGGVRVQSFSDYIPRLVFDYLQMTADLSAKKLPAHAYSKEDIFVLQFGKTGIKINMSLVPAVAKDGIAPGLDKDGNYVWVDGHTFASDFHDKGSGQRGFELAVKIQNTEGYAQNCGTIAVGVSDEHIIKMLKDNDIRMVIPYHKSSLNHFVAQMGNIDQYKDYTNVQNTRDRATGKKIEGKDFNFNEAFHRLGDAKAATNEYLAWCEKNNYIPKFDTFAFHEDAQVRENYYKVLIDFAAYDSEGNSIPQQAVTMNFPTENDAFGSMKSLIEKGLEADAILEGRKASDIPKILEEVKSVLGTATEGKKFSLKEGEAEQKNTDKKGGADNDTIDLTDNTDLSARVENQKGAKKYKIIRDYILEVLGEAPIVLSDGTVAKVDRSDALHLANKSANKKIAHIAKIKTIIERAKLYAVETQVEHKKFDEFRYYQANVKYGDEVYSVYLNVGRSKNGDGYHIYDITKKIGATVKQKDALERVENDLRSETDSPISSRIISQNPKFVKGEFSATTDEGIDGGKKYSLKVKNKKTIDFLENQEHITTYKAMQLIDGKLYPPMAAKTKGEDGKYRLTNPSTLGAWQQAVEDTTNIKFSGDKDYGYYVLNKGDGSSVTAAYNPYEHSSNLVLNDQFEGAYKRDNLVTVECVIPKSEMTSKYKARHAKDSTGVLDWKSGVVAGKIKDNKRKVYLSRWLKPVRILTDAETAKMYKEALGNSGVSVPFNVVTPSLLSELEKIGVPIDREGSPLYKSNQEKNRAKSQTNYSLKGTEHDISLKDVPKVRKAVADKNAEVLAKYVDSGAISTDVYNQLIEEFGAIPAGENPYRDVQVPSKTAKNKKVSQTVRTILEAEATPDEAVPTIEKMVEDGIFSYDVYTDKQAIENGEDYIKKHGWEESLLDWFGAVEKGEVSKDITTTGWILYNHAANKAATETDVDARKEAVKTSIRILDAMVKHQRSAAQALQATRILKKLSPEAQLYGVQKSVEALQQELKNKYDKKAPDLKIDEDLAEQFLNAKTPEERTAAEVEIYKDIGRQMPSNWMDKWTAWRYIAMLTNPRTHVRNIFGNAFFAPVVATKNLTATAIESIVYRVSGKKTVRGKALITGSKADRALLKAAWGDYGNVADMISNGGKYNDSAMGNEHIQKGRRIFKGILMPVEMVRRGNSYLLEWEDMIFSKPHYAYALAQYCKAHNITAEQLQRGKAIAPAREYAIKEAQKATYRDTNAFSQMISDLGRSGKRNWATNLKRTLVEGVLPFRKTPANILARGVEYSPIGFVKGIADLFKVGKEVDGRVFTASEAIDSISAGLTGTGLLALGWFLAAQGIIRGHGGEDKEEKEFKELMGHQDYSLELPNGQSVTLDWLAPESLPFFTGVALYELKKGDKKDLTLADLQTAISGISDPMLEMSFLQGLNDALESIGYAKSNETKAIPTLISTVISSYISQGIPTLFGQIERTTEEERMTTYTDKNGIVNSDTQYALGKASAKIPFWDYNQIPYIDAWGRQEASGSALKRGLNNFLNPAYTSTIETSSMENELLRLYESTGEGGVFPERADKYFTVDGNRKDLTADEYVRYATKKGQKSYNLVTDLVKSKAYKKLSDEEKVKAIKEAYDYANQKAKEAISNYKPDTWVSKADEFGSNVENYITFKTEVSGTKEENGGKISKSEVVDIILDMAKNDSEMWAMYLSEYDAKKDVAIQNAGVDGEDYMTVLQNIDKYDKPNKNGNLGTYTNDEIATAIKKTSGLTKKERAILWQQLTGSTSTKNNPWRSYLP